MCHDALQLHACGVPTPHTNDVYTIPTFPTPTDSPVIYVDSNAAAPPTDGAGGAGAGGNGIGDEVNPFTTLDAAVASITAGAYKAGPKTIVLKGGEVLHCRYG